MGLGKVNTGGGGSGGTLVVTAPVGVTVTATKDEKTYTRIANADGIAKFTGLASGTWQLSIDDDAHEPSTPVTVEITADYVITLAFFAAEIVVTYPAYSTCTCSQGTTELVDYNATDAEKTVTFVVPNDGWWTVICTDDPDNSEKAKKEVEITENGQTVPVKLAYEKWLYNEGEEFTDETGGWNVHKNSGFGAVVSKEADHISLSSGVTGSSEGAICMAETNNAIDPTGYANLNVHVQKAVYSSNPIKVFLGSTVVGEFKESVTDKTWTIPLGSASAGVVKIQTTSYDQNASSISFSKVWLS